MSQFSLTVEELSGIVSGQGNVGWNGAQQLYDMCNVVWRTMSTCLLLATKQSWRTILLYNVEVGLGLDITLMLDIHRLKGMKRDRLPSRN